ncbi:unnamed protein product, partial [Protopolystoma xenopodis]
MNGNQQMSRENRGDGSSITRVGTPTSQGPSASSTLSSYEAVSELADLLAPPDAFAASSQTGNLLFGASVCTTGHATDSGSRRSAGQKTSAGDRSSPLATGSELAEQSLGTAAATRAPVNQHRRQISLIQISIDRLPRQARRPRTAVRGEGLDEEEDEQEEEEEEEEEEQEEEELEQALDGENEEDDADEQNGTLAGRIHAIHARDLVSYEVHSSEVRRSKSLGSTASRKQCQHHSRLLLSPQQRLLQPWRPTALYARQVPAMQQQHQILVPQPARAQQRFKTHKYLE